MAKGAQKAFDEGKFENLAYFEPFYLKDFIATVSKKNLW
jgi:tRNA threonylcarbamoyladenosine biosynthesis protein TsaB